MLNYTSPIKENKNYDNLIIKEIAPIMKLNLRGKKREFLSTVGKTLNMILPTEANTSSSSEKLTAIWLSPDEWMIVSNNITENPKEVLEEGAQIVSEISKKPIEMLGHVTSSYYSPNLNKSIALAVVRNGKQILGQKLFVPMENKTINVTVTDSVFFDKENKRLNA